MQPPETEKCFILCEADVARRVRNDGKVFQYSRTGNAMEKREFSVETVSGIRRGSRRDVSGNSGKNKQDC